MMMEETLRGNVFLLFPGNTWNTFLGNVSLMGRER